MKKLIDVFQSMTSFERLDEAYRHARKQKRYRNEVLAFSNDLDSNLHRIQDEVREERFQFGPYRKHWVYVPKKRLVMALPFDSRIVQWCIYLELNPFFDNLFIEDSFACRKKKGSLKAARRLQYWLVQIENKPGDWYVLKLDISKYFYRIDHEVLLEILGNRIEDERLMRLLETIIGSDDEKFGLPRFASAEDVEEEEWLGDVGMPIGNLTSQLFANIYLNELDQFCKHVLHIHYYVRYMDDVIVIAPDKETAQRYKEEIARFLMERLHLDLNSKTQIKPVDKHGIEFVGYRISAKHAKGYNQKVHIKGWENGKPYERDATKYVIEDGGLVLRKQTVRRIKSAFRGICKRYFDGRLTKGEFERRVASYKGMIQHCDNDKLKARLNEIYIHARETAGVVPIRRCYNCVNFYQDYFCGYAACNCKVYGSLDVDQNERHSDTSAETCKDYKDRQEETSREQLRNHSNIVQHRRKTEPHCPRTGECSGPGGSCLHGGRVQRGK